MPSIGLTGTSGSPLVVKTAEDVVDVLDTVYIDASSTNIPASASTPLTVVASTAAAIVRVLPSDTTGEFINLYSDPSGTPVLECTFGPGTDQAVQLQIPAGTELGLRNAKNAVISVGDFSMNLIG